MSSRMVGFAAGSAAGMIGSRLIALVEDAPDSEFAKRMWNLLSLGSPFEAVTDELVSFGLSNLPALVVAEFDSGSLRALVRGSMLLTVKHLDESPDVEVGGDGFYTWNEYRATSVACISMGLASGPETSVVYRSSLGLVPASQILASVGDSGEQDWNIAVDTPESDLEPEGIVDDASLGEVDPPPDSQALRSTAPVDGDPYAAVHAQPPEFEPPIEQIEQPEPMEGDVYASTETNADLEPIESGSVPAASDPASSAPAAAPGENLTVRFDEQLMTSATKEEDEIAADSTEIDQPAHVESGGAAASAVDNLDDDSRDEVTDDFGALFGETEFRPVSHAGVAEDPAEAGSGGLISEMPPGFGSGTSSAGSVEGHEAGLGDVGDHDGMTISVAQLRAGMANPSGVSSVLGVGQLPMVHAVTCAAGHPNPPSAVTCRRCGIEIQSQSHISVPRPSLGVLVFSSGDRRELTRNMILGRAPKIQGMLEGEMPELVSLPSPTKELSSTHLEVRIEGWQVLLVDRNSTNGTVVTLPNRDPQRLIPGESLPIVPGTWVDMADEVQFTYEVTG